MKNILWYLIATKSEVEKNATPTYSVVLQTQEYGRLEFMIYRGFGFSIVYKDNYLPINLNNQNPFQFNEYLVFWDINDNFWFGFDQDEAGR